MQQILKRKKLLVGILLFLLSVVGKAQQVLEQVKAKVVYITAAIPNADSNTKAATTAWVKRQSFISRNSFNRRAVLYVSPTTGFIKSDSTQFWYDEASSYLTIGANMAPGTLSGILLNTGRGEINAAFGGMVFNVGAGFAGVVVDQTKSFKFSNRGKLYLQIGSNTTLDHYFRLQNDVLSFFPQAATGTNSVAGISATTGQLTGLAKDTFLINNFSTMVQAASPTLLVDSPLLITAGVLLSIDTSTVNNKAVVNQFQIKNKIGGTIGALAKFAAGNRLVNAVAETDYVGTASMRQFVTRVLVGTNANITAIPGTAYRLPAATLTESRNIDISGLNTAGDYIELDNEEAGFTWNITGATLFLGDGVTTVTSVLSGATTQIRFNGTKIKIIN